jgi:hypothetical protein
MLSLKEMVSDSAPSDCEQTIQRPRHPTCDISPTLPFTTLDPAGIRLWTSTRFPAYGSVEVSKPTDSHGAVRRNPLHRGALVERHKAGISTVTDILFCKRPRARHQQCPRLARRPRRHVGRGEKGCPETGTECERVCEIESRDRWVTVG